MSCKKIGQNNVKINLEQTSVKAKINCLQQNCHFQDKLNPKLNTAEVKKQNGPF